MRILHLASFSGNIGDLANHQGFRKMFAEIIDNTAEWTNVEIREFYWKERAFDEKFVTEINQYDMFVIGGGNYLELWVDSSPTGTSLAFPLNLFEQINIPIIFNALGVDDGQGVSVSALDKFTAFLKIINNNPRIFFSVRNDGSYSTLHKYFPDDALTKVFKCPDGGFNSSFQISDKDSNEKRNILIGVNLACDMPGIRFTSDFTIDDFSKSFAHLLVKLGEKNGDSEFVFFPHIYSDYDIFYRVILNLPDRFRRTRLRISSYGPGIPGAEKTFSDYNLCDLVLGVRFHSNVYSIAQGIPTIGIENYPQIGKLYSELDFNSGVVKVQSNKDFQSLLDLSEKYLNEPKKYKKIYSGIAEKMKNQYYSYGENLKSWIVNNN